MKRKLVSLALVMLALCLIIPSVSAKAEISHDRQTFTEKESSTTIIPLEPDFYPYTQAKITITITGTTTVMSNQVTDAEGKMHLNGKALMRVTFRGEAWLLDSVREVWVLGTKTMQSGSQFFGYNEFSVDSEVQTSQETRFFMTRVKLSGLDLATGEPMDLNILLVEHFIFKFNHGELQFEKSWDISHGSSSLM